MRTAVVGIGNEMKGDDGIGIRVAKQLQEDWPAAREKDTLVIPAEVPENYIQPIIRFRPELLILVDASDFQGKAGDVRAIREEEVSSVYTNTHSVPILLFLEAIKKEVPNLRTVFMGIQPKSTQFGKPMSPEVREAGRKAGDAIRKIASGEVNV